MLKKVEKIFSYFKRKKYPSQKQWRQILKILNQKEKILFFIFIGTFLLSFFYLSFNFYFKNTEIQPAKGGIFAEGAIGQPRFINPIYSSFSDIDQGLTELIFSGLMKYDNQGKIILNLAEEYKILNNGIVYEVKLRENIFWSDGFPLTVDDVIFTIETIQNPDYKSPQIPAWLGVEIERVSDLIVRFKLRNPYSGFLENLTQKIIPKHIWKDIPAENFHLSGYNLNPIGSGPYKLKSLERNRKEQIVSLNLIRNQKYFGKTPYLSQISFYFFENEDDLIRNYKRGTIQGFSLKNPLTLEQLPGSVKIYSFSLPRYFALFFNSEKSKILESQNIRLALSYGTNKNEILEKAFLNFGKIVDSPILPEIYGFNNPSEIYQFSTETANLLLEEEGFRKREDGLRIKTIERRPAFQFRSDLREGSRGREVEELQRCLAQYPEIYPERQITGFFGKTTERAIIRFQEKHKEEILEPWGFKKGTGLVSRTTRNKLNEICFPSDQEFSPLKFSLTTINQPALVKTAELLKEQWKTLGVELEIKILDELTEVIRQRDYEILLFGQALTMVPDPFPFWHSGQIENPGLNLSLYQNKKIDNLLEKARQTLNQEERKEKLEEFQELLIKDAPAIFLNSPYYLYFVSEKIKGIQEGIIVNPSKRFLDIENWHIKTRRIWK